MENANNTADSLKVLFTTLHERGVTLWVEGDRLRSRAPKDAITPALREQIGAQKEAIIQWLRQAQVQVAPTKATLQPQPRCNEAPLSFAQERLWVLDQLTGPNATYNMTGALRLTGRLRVIALEQSLRTLVTRHEILRTTFVTVNGAARQVIGEPRLTLPLIDLTDMPEQTQAQEVLRLLHAEARQPFDLTQGPLLRVTLLKLRAATQPGGAEVHLLLFTMHHIIADGWSHSIIEQELTALYGAFVRGEANPLPPLPLQYADYAIWQRQWLTAERLAEQTAYWQTQLGNNPPVLHLPTDRLRPKIRTQRGARLRFHWSPALSDRLREVSQAHEATLFMTLLAAFDVLLYWYSGQEEIVVGTDVANRNLTQLEGLVGFFVNQLVMKTSLRGSPTFRELVEQVKQVALGAYAHQDLPFDKLVDALGIPRDLSRTPLFQVKLVLQNLATTPFTLPDLQLEPVLLDTGTAKFDILINLWDDAAGIQGEVEYSTDLYQRATIERMMQLYEVVLHAVVAQPGSKLAHLTHLIGQREQARQQLARSDGKAMSQRKRQLVKRKAVSRETT
ncbi:MAG: condensation domain-containing protein [Caldilineaceae bacterium]